MGWARRSSAALTLLLAAGLAYPSGTRAQAPAPADIPGEIIVRTRAATPQEALNPTLQAAGLTIAESTRLTLLDSVLYRLRASSAQAVPAALDSLRANTAVVDAQPNQRYLFAQTSRPQGDSAQYVVAKWLLPEVHQSATGAGIRVAIIDSAVDLQHPDLQSAIEQSAPSDIASKGHPHGTGMAGAIAARQRLLGVAPDTRLLAFNGFSADAVAPSTFTFVKGIDWAVDQRAQIINMSFAGPRSRVAEITLKSAYEKGVILIAAAGNAGPSSPPLYPGADPNVIAVTATDSDDHIYSKSNRGKYIAVAAPGVDILLPAPDGGYQLTTGTSVAAAHVAGVVALLLQINPTLQPNDIRRILMATAKKLPAKAEAVGAGLVDPAQALKAALAAKK